MLGRQSMGLQPCKQITVLGSEQAWEDFYSEHLCPWLSLGLPTQLYILALISPFPSAWIASFCPLKLNPPTP
ncbi:hypothetical protein ACQP3C_29430, partial [Escherichia coli]